MKGTFAQQYHSMPGPHAPIVVITATSENERALHEIGAHACLLKPFSIDEVLDTIERVEILPGSLGPSPLAGERGAPVRLSAHGC